MYLKQSLTRKLPTSPQVVGGGQIDTVGMAPNVLDSVLLLSA